MTHNAAAFSPLNIAVLTVSDTRTMDTDTSGQVLVDSASEAGHRIADRQLQPDDIYRIRAVVSQWIAQPEVQVILITGGTGFTGRDSTPEAITPLLDKMVDGFGELFRHVSWEEIGTSTLQSRAPAGRGAPVKMRAQVPDSSAAGAMPAVMRWLTGKPVSSAVCISALLSA